MHYPESGSIPDEQLARGVKLPAQALQEHPSQCAWSSPTGSHRHHHIEIFCASTDLS